MFLEASARRGWGRPEVVAWRDFLDDPAQLDARVGPRTWLRVESPGEDHEVFVRLLAWGAGEPDAEQDAPRLSADAALHLTYERGRVRWLRQEYLGLRSALRRIAATGARALTAPAQAAAMTDKPTTQARLVEAGVAVPEPLGVVGSYAELEALQARHGAPRVFLKPRNGSSASGVMALARGGARVVATTSLERDGDRLFNSLRLRRYQRESDVAALVDVLGPEGIHVERWVPKQGAAGRVLDLRVLVVAGEAAHVVVRTSSTPLTNLHLGNRRGDVGATQQRLGPRWAQALEVARRAVAAFPGALYAGVDVLVPARGRPPCVAEVNAWGDLLPGVRWRDMDPYEAQLQALEAA
jgi:glutathione synthase/RimK-type ligase-like ATP-grasp enzyme